MTRDNNTNNTQLATNSNLPTEVQSLYLKQSDIESIIFEIRGVQVIVDRHLAQLYGVTTSKMNQQVKRNIARFPETFRFQLTEAERDEVITKCDNLQSLKFNPSLPFVFTEQGIAQLSSVLHSPTAIDMSVKIMNAFVAMRRFLVSNAVVFQRLESLERHQLLTNQRLDDVFKRLDAHTKPQQGIFFDGQVFDAYQFVCDLIRKAEKSIILIDNYIDDTVLTMLDKRRKGVTATIYTQHINQQLKLDIERHNIQYPTIDVIHFNKAHDRFILIDEEVYHIGASIKDLGKKWFGFTLMRDITVEELVSKIGSIIN